MRPLAPTSTAQNLTSNCVSIVPQNSDQTSILSNLVHVLSSHSRFVWDHQSTCVDTACTMMSGHCRDLCIMSEYLSRPLRSTTNTQCWCVIQERRCTCRVVATHLRCLFSFGETNQLLLSVEWVVAFLIDNFAWTICLFTLLFSKSKFPTSSALSPLFETVRHLIHCPCLGKVLFVSFHFISHSNSLFICENLQSQHHEVNQVCLHQKQMWYPLLLSIVGIE